MSEQDDSPTPPAEAEKRERYRERMRSARASAIGLQFGISIAIGAFAGHWLDKRFDTEPWLLLLGIVLGSAAAFRDMAKLARDEED